MSLVDCLEGLTSKRSDKSQWVSLEDSELGTFDNLSTYEIWNRSDGLEPVVNKKTGILGSTPARNIFEPPNDAHITGGIRIVVFEKWEDTETINNFKTEIMRDAIRSVHLPLWIPARLFTHAFFCDPGNRRIETTSRIRKYWQRMRGGLLLWSHDTQTCITRAVYFCRHIQYWDAFEEALDRCKTYASLPMLPGVLGYMQHVQVSVGKIYWVQDEIKKLLARVDSNLAVADQMSVINQHNMDDKSWKHEQLESIENQTRELVHTAQAAAWLITDLPDNRGNLYRISASLTLIRAENEAFQESWMSTSRDKALQAQELSGLIDNMMVEMNSQILAANWMFTKIDSLIKNTNLTINRADQRSSIQIADSSHTIAVESKRDNLSMMTIAAITMIFLPGTFVASLFAMPVLDWSVQHKPHVIQSGFWIYWAITVPLTVLTVLLWLAWFLRNDIKKWWRTRSQHNTNLPPSGRRSTNMNPNQLNGHVIGDHQPGPPTKAPAREEWTTPRSGIDWSNRNMAYNS